MERRKFNREDKLKILKEAGENGVMETLNKHSVLMEEEVRGDGRERASA